MLKNKEEKPKDENYSIFAITTRIFKKNFSNI